MFKFTTLNNTFALIWHGKFANVIYAEIDGSEFYTIETLKKD